MVAEVINYLMCLNNRSRYDIADYVLQHLLNAVFKILDVQAGIIYAYLSSIYIDSSASVKCITQDNPSILVLPAFQLPCWLFWFSI